MEFGLEKNVVRAYKLDECKRNTLRGPPFDYPFIKNIL